MYNIANEASYATPFSTSPLLPLLLISLSSQKNAPDTTTDIKPEYDYIVVGAGSAGSVVAARLSELSCVTVLLLEAGKAPPLLTDVPVIGRSFVNSDIDWKYKTTPQKFTGAGLINNEVAWPSGKTLGGCSVINAMLAVRGNRRNYDDWATLGATGWSYEEVLPYFKKLEDDVNPKYVANGFHGTKGPVTVSKPRYNSEIKAPIFAEARAQGYRIGDANGPIQTGFYNEQSTIRDGQRCSASKAYLVPNDQRENLDIVAEAFVRKVTISSGRTQGVIFDFQGKRRGVKARREVILSAGAINSAQLLMLSGIGPKEELLKHNIPVVADLPVGQNLQDHCGTAMNFQLSDDIPSIGEKLANQTIIQQYITKKRGVLASSEAVSTVAFLNRPGFRIPVDFPDYELYFLEFSTNEPKNTYNMKPEYFQQIYGPYVNKTLYKCIAHMLQPKSRGNVTIRSSDPYDPPIIDPNYLSDPDDLKVLVAGMKKCQEFGTSEPLKKLGSKPFTTVYPGCKNYVSNEDQYFRCMAQAVVITLNHEVGTAKMGNALDPTTVVDPQLRVKKIDGLRVVDASVMPLVPSGNTNLPTMMVAEKASDMIKEGLRCE